MSETAGDQRSSRAAHNVKFEAWQERAPNGDWFVTVIRPDGERWEIYAGSRDDGDLARFLAAAPRMYEALSRAIPNLSTGADHGQLCGCWRCEIRAALSAANGEQS